MSLLVVFQDAREDIEDVYGPSTSAIYENMEKKMFMNNP